MAVFMSESVPFPSEPRPAAPAPATSPLRITFPESLPVSGKRDEIMAAIHALSGQELAGTYNEAPASSPVERLKQVLPHERR